MLLLCLSDTKRQDSSRMTNQLARGPDTLGNKRRNLKRRRQVERPRMEEKQDQGNRASPEESILWK